MIPELPLAMAESTSFVVTVPFFVRVLEDDDVGAWMAATISMSPSASSDALPPAVPPPKPSTLTVDTFDENELIPFAVA
jgi:hypothetical protein